MKIKVGRRIWKPIVLVRNIIILILVIATIAIVGRFVVKGLSESMDIDYCKFNRNPAFETFKQCMERING